MLVSAEAGESERGVRALDDGVLIVSVTVPVSVRGRTRLAEYSLTVYPVTLERIDIVEACLADIEDDGCGVCQAAARVSSISEFAVDEVTTCVCESRQCMWKALPGGCFDVQNDGDVTAQHAGTLLLTLQLLYVTGARQSRVAVWKSHALVLLEDAYGIKTETRGSFYLS